MLMRFEANIVAFNLTALIGQGMACELLGYGLVHERDLLRRAERLLEAFHLGDRIILVFFGLLVGTTAAILFVFSAIFFRSSRLIYL